MTPWGSPLLPAAGERGGWLELLQHGLGYPQRRCGAELSVEEHVLISWPAVWPDYLPGGYSGRLTSAKLQPPPTCPISPASVVNHFANFSVTSPSAPEKCLPPLFGDTLTPKGNVLGHVTLRQTPLSIAAQVRVSGPTALITLSNSSSSRGCSMPRF
jgi:hypothetical protein